MTKLSVNINKVATLRNARGGNNPDLLKVAKDIQKFGADGITIHPRPDERHIKYNDAINLKDVVQTELNIEGNPIDKFVELVFYNQILFCCFLGYKNFHLLFLLVKILVNEFYLSCHECINILFHNQVLSLI